MYDDVYKQVSAIIVIVLNIPVYLVYEYNYAVK